MKHTIEEKNAMQATMHKIIDSVDIIEDSRKTAYTREEVVKMFNVAKLKMKRQCSEIIRISN